MSEKIKKKDLEALEPKEQTQRLRVRTPFFRTFILLGKLLDIKNNTINEIIVKSLKNVLVSLEIDGKNDDLEGIVTAIKPSLSFSLSYSDYEIRELSFKAISEIMEKGYDLTYLFPNLAKSLKKEPSWTAIRAAATFENLANQGWDLSPIVSELTEALLSDNDSLRYYSSQALSKHFINIKKEAPLILEENVDVSNSNLWKEIVSHRRMWAKNDTPLKIKTDMNWHTCGVCGSNKLDLIYHLKDAGTGWKFLKYEYKCKDCGKYSLYSYDD